MSTYVLPQVQVFQDFTTVPAVVANPLRAHISGGHARLIRYAQAAEQADGLLGYYDNLEDTPYAWPNRPAGGIVDEPYTEVWVKNALLRYFQDTIGSGSVITKTTGVNNQIRSATVNFAANGDAYPRAAALLDRDVQPGDIALVRGIDTDDNSISLWTYVRALVGDTEAAVIAAATADAGNQTHGGSPVAVTGVQTAGPINCVGLTAAGTGYDGLESGFITETYDLLVTQASVNGDFTTALVRVISGSGEDDQDAVSPAAAGFEFAVGTRGLMATFAEDPSAGCSASATHEAVSPNDLLVGQRFRLTVFDYYAGSTATSGGTYTDPRSTTYVVTVSKGGAGTAQITCTTTTGIDLSGPTDILATNTPVPVGSFGVTVEFNTTALRFGDRFYIPVTGTSVGPMRSIVLGHNLDTAIPAGSQVDLTLFIKQPNLQLAENRVGFAPLTNWQTSDTQVTVSAGAIAYDPTWTDGGVQQPLDLAAGVPAQGTGQLFVQARYWLNTLCTELNAIADVGDLDTAISGALDPDNPLKWGVSQALANSNGTEVKFTSVCNPDDPDSWANVLALLLGRTDVYGLVPLTYDPTVLHLYAAHVDDQSGATEACWRGLWVNLQGVPLIPLVSAGSAIPGYTQATTTDGQVCLAVIEDDPATTGTQYTIVRCTSGNGAFLTNGMQGGDTVRTFYTTDGFGSTIWTEYTVDAVLSEDELRLVAGPDVAVSVPSKVEIWRAQTATAEANSIALNAGAWGNRRVKATWPDTIDSSGTTMPGYFLNCALAGLSSAVLPQQGLTHVAIAGYTGAPRTTSKFNRSQLDAMAGAGCWIVTQDLTGAVTSVGQIFTRDAVTTGTSSDINQREESVTRNVDSISFQFQETLAPFIGVTNVTPVIQSRIGLESQKLIDLLKVVGSATNAGPQLLDPSEITSLTVSPIDPSRYVMNVGITVPYVTNVIEVHVQL